MSYVSIYEDAKAARLEKEVEFINDIFESFAPEWYLSQKSRQSLKFFVDGVGMYQAEIAMNEAVERFDENRNGRDIFLYFCGVCWDKMTELSVGGK